MSRLKDTPCGKCKLGIISHGPVPGHAEMAKILEVLPGKVSKEAFVWGVPEGEKQKHVKKIVDHYASQGTHIANENIYFFDDKFDNVAGFEKYKRGGKPVYPNAHQVSCKSRDTEHPSHDIKKNIGKCGATFSEIQKHGGIKFCH